jgi:hypothetical protein
MSSLSQVNPDTLLIIKRCNNTAAITDQEVRAAFKQYALGKIAKF